VLLKCIKCALVGTVKKWEKAFISSAMSACQSVCLSACYQYGGSHRTDFHWNWIFGTFMKICWETPNLGEIGQQCWVPYTNTKVPYTDTKVHLYGWKQYSIFCCSVVVEGEPIVHFHGKAWWFFFFLLTAECRSTTVQTEHIIVFL
jgi:hypothetical protein